MADTRWLVIKTSYFTCEVEEDEASTPEEAIAVAEEYGEFVWDEADEYEVRDEHEDEPRPADSM